MQQLHHRGIAPALVLAVVLTACSGGSGGDAAPSAEQTTRPVVTSTSTTTSSSTTSTTTTAPPAPSTTSAPTTTPTTSAPPPPPPPAAWSTPEDTAEAVLDHWLQRRLGELGHLDPDGALQPIAALEPAGARITRSPACQQTESQVGIDAACDFSILEAAGLTHEIVLWLRQSTPGASWMVIAVETQIFGGM